MVPDTESRSSRHAFSLPLDPWIARLPSHLQPAYGPGVTQKFADLVRAAALLSCVAAAIWWGIPEIALFAAVAGLLLVPRFAHVPGPFDLAFAVTVLVAAWSGVLGWYANISWWDIPVHLLSTGACAAMACFLLSRAHVVMRLRHRRGDVRHATRLIVLTFAFGLSVAVLWEFVEWFGHTFISSSIHVGYLDTIGDMAAGAIGSLIAGLCLAAWSPGKPEATESDQHQT